jgi:hypothetical protein
MWFSFLLTGMIELFEDNKMFSGNSVLSANNQTPCKTNVMYYRRKENNFYFEIASDITTREK